MSLLLSKYSYVIHGPKITKIKTSSFTSFILHKNVFSLQTRFCYIFPSFLTLLYVKDKNASYTNKHR